MSGELQALLDPAHQVASHVEQHPNFVIASVQQRLIEFLGRVLARRQKTLKHQTGARALDQLVASARLGEWMENQGRQLLRGGDGAHCIPYRKNNYPQLTAFRKQYLSLNRLGPS